MELSLSIDEDLERARRKVELVPFFGLMIVGKYAVRSPIAIVVESDG